MNHTPTTRSRSPLPLAATLALAAFAPHAHAQLTPGRNDVAIVVPNFAFWAVDFNSDALFDWGEQWGLPGDQFLAGQPLRAYHDAFDEMIVVRNGEWFVKVNDLRPGFSGRFVRSPFGGPGTIGCVCDIDGDGYDNALALYVPTLPAYRFLRIDVDGDLQLTTRDRSMSFPIAFNSNDRLLGGRLGRLQRWDELTVFRNATGHWDLYTTDRGTPTTNVYARPQFGLPGDLPMLADMNNDGVDDLLVFRPAMNWVFINYWESGQSHGGYGPDGDVDRTVNYQGHVLAANQALAMPGRRWDLGAVAFRFE